MKTCGRSFLQAYWSFWRHIVNKTVEFFSFYTLNLIKEAKIVLQAKEETPITQRFRDFFPSVYSISSYFIIYVTEKPWGDVKYMFSWVDLRCLWFRRLKRSTTCKPGPACGGSHPGFMIGGNPKQIGKNARKKKVCFVDGNNCCAKHVYIKVKRCPGNFLVYQLPAPPSGSYRYCGQKRKKVVHNYSKRINVSYKVELSKVM